jgi:hypothetical protein
LPPNPPPKINTRIGEIMAWKNGKRVGLGSAAFLNSTRWIRLAVPGYVIYSEPDDSHQILDVPPPGTGNRDGGERRGRIKQPCQYQNGCHCCSVNRDSLDHDFE